MPFGQNYRNTLLARQLAYQDQQDQLMQRLALDEEARRRASTEQAFGQIMDVMKLVDSRQDRDRQAELKSREIEAKAAGTLGREKPTPDLPFSFGERGQAGIDAGYAEGQVGQQQMQNRLDYQEAMLNRQLQVEGARGENRRELEKLQQLGRLERIDVQLDAKIQELEQRRRNNLDLAGVKGEIALMLKERQIAADQLLQADKYRRLGILQDDKYQHLGALQADKYDRIGTLQDDRQEHATGLEELKDAAPSDLLASLERTLEKLATGKEGSFMEGMQYIPSAIQARQRLQLLAEMKARGLSPAEILKSLGDEGFFNLEAPKSEDELLLERLQSE